MGAAEVNWAYFLETRARSPRFVPTQDFALCKFWVCTAQRQVFKAGTIAKAMFIKSGEQVSLTIFDDTLITLRNQSFETKCLISMKKTQQHSYYL